MRLLASIGALLIAVALAPGAAAGVPDTGGRHHDLRFRPVLLELPPEPAKAPPTTNPAGMFAIATCDPAAVAAQADVPTTARADDRPDACVVLADGPGRVRYLLGKTALDVTAVRSARAHFEKGTGYVVLLRFTKQGAAQFDAVSTTYFHQRIAIVFDSVVQSAPVIEPNNQAFSSYHGLAVISGDYTKQEARTLATAINRAAHA